MASSHTYLWSVTTIGPIVRPVGNNETNFHQKWNQSAKICRRKVGDGRRPPHGGRRQSQGDRLIKTDLSPSIKDHTANRSPTDRQPISGNQVILGSRRLVFRWSLAVGDHGHPPVGDLSGRRLLKTTEDHQLFGGCSWSLVVGSPCVTGV